MELLLFKGDGGYDLYAIAGNEVLHAATDGERYCYYLWEDDSIHYWDSNKICYIVDKNQQINI